MTREEVVNMLTLLRISYPNFYSKMKSNDMRMVVDLWSEMFASDDADIVKYSLKELIATHTGFPPDVAAIKNKMKELVCSATGEATDEDLWIMLKGAVRNGLYGANEEFDKLPKVLRRYLGTPSTLREYAMIDSDTFNTVNHGQFLKQIKVIKDREEYSLKMPDDVKVLISKVFTPLVETRPLLEPEKNERRNAVLDALTDGDDKRGSETGSYE